jgi:hypothetical protein
LNHFVSSNPAISKSPDRVWPTNWLRDGLKNDAFGPKR